MSWIWYIVLIYIGIGILSGLYVIDTTASTPELREHYEEMFGDDANRIIRGIAITTGILWPWFVSRGTYMFLKARKENKNV